MIQNTSLGEVCFFENGDRGKNYPSQSSFVKEGIPFINAGDLYENRIKKEGLSFITEEKYKSLGSGKIQQNDILFCLRGSLGKFAINDQKLIGAIASSLVIIRPSEKLDVHYLKNFLRSPGLKRQIEKSDNGSSQPNLAAGNVKKFKIPLPPLATQKKIAAILDAADAHRQKTKQLLAKYDELAKSIFLEMFGDPVTNPKGWEKVKLGSVTNMKAGKFVPASEIFSNPNDNMHECYGGNGLRGYVNSHTHKGDFVLIGRQGALCGNVKIVSGVFHATEHAIVCSPKKKYETMWLYFLLDLLNLNKYATGAAQPGLNVGKLVEIEIVLPPQSLQMQFVERFNLIEKQKVQSQQGLDQSENLFNGILQKAFKGELL